VFKERIGVLYWEYYFLVAALQQQKTSFYSRVTTLQSQRKSKNEEPVPRNSNWYPVP